MINFLILVVFGNFILMYKMFFVKYQIPKIQKIDAHIISNTPIPKK